jgi:hypothetical protein
VPLEVETEEMGESEIEMPTSDELKEIQSAMLIVKNVVREINFEENITKNIEVDYVNDRKTKPLYGQEQFKLVLSLTKYISVLEGTGNPTMEDFIKAKELVFEMMRRNEVRYPPTPAAKDPNTK